MSAQDAGAPPLAAGYRWGCGRSADRGALAFYHHWGFQP